MNTRKRKDAGSESMSVQEVVEQHSNRQLPLVGEDTPIAELAKAIEWYRHSRQLYVVDKKDRLLGHITLARLVMFVFASSHGSSMNPRHVMGLITCKTAGDLMSEGTLFTGMDERVEDLLQRMVEGHVDEVPVLDETGRIVADLTMIDLLMAETKQGV